MCMWRPMHLLAGAREGGSSQPGDDVLGRPSWVGVVGWSEAPAGWHWARMGSFKEKAHLSPSFLPPLQARGPAGGGAAD